MELNKYIFPLWKWWWLVIASTLVAGVFSYLAMQRQPTIYQARTTLMIGTTINDPNPSSNEFMLGQQLAVTYADVANREIVRNATMRALNLNRLPQYVARALPNTQLIEIAVTDTDPERSQLVANELAAQLILLSPTSGQPEEQERQEFINRRLDNLEVQITETEAEIERLQEELSTLISALEINETQNQIAALQSKLDTMQNQYSSLLANTKQGAVNTLTVIESATGTSRPVGPRRGITVLLAVAFALVLSSGEAYLLERLDDTLKTTDEVSGLFSAPIVGHIFEDVDGKGDRRLYHKAGLQHPLAEAFRALRTKIEFARVGQPLKTILVTSADIGDGKTSVAANLALFVAQKRKKVVLLDADLRKPAIHKYFNLPNDRGLVDLFLGSAEVADVVRSEKDMDVAVITTGDTPPNPNELLSSDKMDQILAQLKEYADVVIIDSPPFIIADAMVMASKVDGVLLVVRPSHTRRSLARVARDQISQAKARLIGVVLNRIPHRGAQYYAGKSYSYTYHLSNYGFENGKDEVNGDRKKQKGTLLSPVYKVTRSFKNLFRAIFRLNPK